MTRRDGEARGGEVAVVSHASLYSYLVTRQTGQAVRTSIEEQIAARSGPVVTVLDFRHVSVIDFSCADEVVAKLADSAVAPGGGGRTEELLRFFLFTGLDDHHLDPVESALSRRRLTVAAERGDGTPLLLGDLEERPRAVWQRVVRAGVVRPSSLVAEMDLDVRAAREELEGLHRRRLLLRRGQRFLSLREAVDARAREGDSP